MELQQLIKTKHLNTSTVIQILLPRANVKYVKSRLCSYLLSKYGTAKTESYKRNIYSNSQLCRERTICEIFLCFNLTKYSYCIYAYFFISLALYEKKRESLYSDNDVVIDTNLALQKPKLSEVFYNSNNMEGCC